MQHYVPSRGEALAEVIVDRYAAAADFRGDRKGCRCEAHWNKPVASVRRFVPVCGTVFGRPRWPFWSQPYFGRFHRSALTWNMYFLTTPFRFFCTTPRNMGSSENVKAKMQCYGLTVMLKGVVPSHPVDNKFATLNNLCQIERIIDVWLITVKELVL